MHNLRAALSMIGAMALFAVEDMFLKLLAERLSVGQVLVMTGTLATAVFWALIALQGGRLWTRELLHPMVMLRNLGEGLACVLFLSALVLGDLATVSAILQALPLMLTLGAVVFLRERVGWRRWLSIVVGMIGVLIVVRPGTAAFQPASALAVGGVLMLTMRDLATRRVPPGISSKTLTASAFASLVPSGLVWMALQSGPVLTPDLTETLQLLCAVAFGLCAYMLMVAAMRLGEIAVIAPFRYTRLLFALILAVLVFGERPDAATLTGAAIIALAGMAAMWREARLARRGR
ncbi:MAG: DMT family transporter [Paracoccus sp. (in: a-proteobacteria)]|uniref:DMT family transporter n=1 Tax=Paracoccus sp. TaxID=267 RepID=UPI0026E0755E|nr:DMT family transporter [Paracoccus sp. (in: a-proteobacteria)]MDO5632669.1 DMT family transporter [Paracoccus sp. (in: a-proteobacteria)]